MALRFTDLCIDAADTHALGSWWAEALGWSREFTDDGDVILRQPGGGPNWLFLAVPEAKTVKNRLHVDLTPDDQQAEVDRLIALGARHVDIGQGEQTWVVLADPEGNEFCVLAPE
ncbi:VOC family protein [Mycobacterium sp. PS03-16]|uniref:VOC family protein n=1 Tax=Mycobacterium sp. PS03-16 TaxID=2559611 RepID=UPI001074746A|nr:VOC family protein [Mycobacterium sp. PS03-16]TFV55491.1 VOC family protein [Mycobacterium sp. PS03-16]